MVSLGCPKNLVDSEVMLGLAKNAGHELTHDAAEADVIIVNTCAFIDPAKQESINTILEMAEYKKHGQCRSLVVTGCMVERYRDELQAQIPEIDAVLGTGEVSEIVSALGSPVTSEVKKQFVPLLQVDRQHAGLTDVPEPRPLPTYLYDADTPRQLSTPGHYAYLKIAEGCDYTCAFCIIPSLRGHYRSRTTDSILQETRAFVERGVREVILNSQDTSFYGNDRGERGALADLLHRLADVNGLDWIRMLYLYPTTITDDVLDAMAIHPQVCRYVDMPLQHVSNHVLRKMKRPGTKASYERLLDRIRSKVPGVALRTTFIVGFPGETEADVDELLAFVHAQRFDHVGVFTYSHEEGTSAHMLNDDVPATAKEERKARVMALQRKLVIEAQRARLGQRVRLLVDGPTAEHELVLRARLESQAPEIDPVVYLTECDPSTIAAGDFVEAEIVDSRDYDLIARPTKAQLAKPTSLSAETPV
jgi:ribosomal protein S12 methylthiotransferase